MKTDLSDIDGPLPDAEALVDLMGQDKKVLDGQLRFILTRGIGKAFVTSDVSRDLIVQVLDEALRV
jgi:3-dehydroquinate synthase